MIIGEQRVSENYYENSNQFEALKRKLSSENETENDLTDYSGGDRSEVVKNNFTTQKMQFVDNIINENYHVYQTTEHVQIHQDGEQSYINLTVMTPSLKHYNKNQVNCDTQTQHHQQQQRHEHINFSISSNIQDDQHLHNHQNDKQIITAATTTANVNKYEVKNYHQSGGVGGKKE